MADGFDSARLGRELMRLLLIAYWRFERGLRPRRRRRLRMGEGMLRGCLCRLLGRRGGCVGYWIMVAVWRFMCLDDRWIDHGEVLWMRAVVWWASHPRRVDAGRMRNAHRPGLDLDLNSMHDSDICRPCRKLRLGCHASRLGIRTVCVPLRGCRHFYLCKIREQDIQARGVELELVPSSPQDMEGMTTEVAESISAQMCQLW